MNLRGKACVVCGNVFLPGSGSQLTCSAECKKELRAIRKGKKASEADALRAVAARDLSRGPPEEASLGEEVQSSDPLEPMVTYIRSVARIVIRKEVGQVLREIFEVKGQSRRE